MYIHFTEEQKQQARETDIVSILQSQGEQVKKSGSEYEWLHNSQKITIRDNLWFHQYERVGGDAIDFVCKFYNKSFQGAMEYLLGNRSCIITHTKQEKKPKQIKKFIPPSKNDNMSRVFNYLTVKRGIDKKVIYSFVYEQMLYESNEYHNAVFLGFDKNGVSCHAHMRGIGANSTYKGNVSGSFPEYSFHRHGESKYLFLFEAPIDMLSFISMHKKDWKKNSYAASCSVSDKVLFQCLKDNPNIQFVYLCFDNDSPGQEANKRIQNKLNALNIKSKILVPKHKDWNEDLIFSKESEVEEQCQTLQL